MTDPDRPTPSRLDEALAHADFLRRLARGLVADEGAADDLVQETWVAALGSPGGGVASFATADQPEVGERGAERDPEARSGGARAWLATVLRRKAINRRRADGRRARRERVGARVEGYEEEDAVARIELQRRLLDLVGELAEPYRATIYQRYYQGLPTGEIARRAGVPPKTVQTRLRRGLELLRERLDRAAPGGREEWLSALAPLLPSGWGLPVWPGGAETGASTGSQAGASASQPSATRVGHQAGEGATGPSSSSSPGTGPSGLPRPDLALQPTGNSVGLPGAASAASAGQGALAVGGFGGIVMKKWAVGMVALGLLAAGGWVGLSLLGEGWSDGRESTEPLGGPGLVDFDPGRPAEVAPTVEPSTVERREVLADAPAAEPREEGELRVRLRWEDGGPATGVGVLVTHPAPGLSREELRYVRSDQDGVALVTGIPAGSVMVQLDRRWLRREAEILAGQRAELDVLLPRGVPLRGRVVDADGEGVGGAELWVAPNSGMWPCFHVATRSAADGGFALEGLDESAYVGARASGHLPSPVVQMEGLALDESGERVLELVLGPAGGGLRGLVLDPDGAPVANAIVLAGPDGGESVELDPGLRAIAARPVRCATGNDGRFDYPGDLAAGRQRVVVGAAGWPSWEGEVEVRAGETVELRVDLRHGAAIAGRLVDASGEPLEGGSIVVAHEIRGGWYEHWMPPPRATSDADGRFRLEGITPGTRELNARPPRENRHLGRARIVLECASGETLDVQLVLDVGRVIDGRVVDETGAPLSNWMIRSTPRTPYEEDGVVSLYYPRDAITAADGRFRLANLGPGLHDLSFAPARYYGAPPASLRGIEAGTVDLEVVIDSAFAPSAFVGGTLGVVPSNARLVIRRDRSSTGYFIDVDATTGRFEHGPLVPGIYRLEVHQAGRTLYVGEHFELSANQRFESEPIELEEPGRVSLRLVGANADELRRLTVNADRAGAATVELERDDDGVCVAELTPGRWILRSWRGRGSGLEMLRSMSLPWAMRDTWVEVRAGETTSIEVAVESVLERSVRVRLAEGVDDDSPVGFELVDEAGALVRRRDDIGYFASSGSELRLRGLETAEGSYRLRVWTQNGREREWEIEFDGPDVPKSPRVFVFD